MIQTISLEIAKQLKEVGWKKETYFAYADGKGELMPLDYHVCNIEVYGYYAPQMHEILEELPYVVWVRKTKFKYSLKVLKLKTEYRVEYSRLDEKGNPHWIACEFDTNIHDCLARMWTWAVKEGYITLNQ